MDTPVLYRISDKKDLSEEDIDYAINLLIESEAIMGNSELYNNILEEANKRSKIYKNLKSLRDHYNEMSLNPGKARGESDEANDAKKEG